MKRVLFLLVALAFGVHAQGVRDSASQALLDRAGALYEKSDWKGAAELYRLAARKGIDPAVSWFNYGNAMAQTGRTGEAAAAWMRALEWAPRFKRARQNLAILAEENRDWGEAAKHWRILWDVDSSDVSSANRLGEISLQAGAHGDAAEWFARSRNVDTTSAAAHLGLARARLGAGDTALALAALDRYAGQAGADTTGRLVLSLGGLYEACRAWRKAERAYQDALLVAPRNVQTWLRLARLSQLRKRDAEAVLVLRQALEQVPGSAQLWKALGQAGARAGNARDAVDGYTKALELGDKTAKAGLRTLQGWLKARGEAALSVQVDSLLKR
jgi:tetratricopeptide (TPR) repeat protein